MIKKSIIFFFAILSTFVIFAQNEDKKLRLWYSQPASIWEEALSLGNGKMGAMVFEGVKNERFQMNDLTLWSGAPKDGNRPNSPETLKATREVVFDGDYVKADSVWRKMHDPYSARYLPMADLMISMNFPDTMITDYYRDSKQILNQ